MENKREYEKDTKGLTVKKEENFSEWYYQLIKKAELADYAPIRGFMVIRPNAYSIWEEIQKNFNETLEKKEIRNSYFPLLIPESFFKREAEHAKGFSPELAYIEGKEEGERLAIRPTSETIIYDSYSKWIRSWRDLPLKLNQWCNTLRWEVKQTKPFIRTREFLWQEGHCVFETEKEADENMNEIILEYKNLIENILAIPVIIGKKSIHEKFPGAQTTMAAEALMPDGKALQMGTSHNLGQGFAKVFGIKYKGKDEKEHYPYQTSWGFSTRLIGALAMTHGDNSGLVLPPKIAKNKIVIIPILFDKNKDKIIKKAKEIQKKLVKFGAILDDRNFSPGWKFNEWELKGIPIRVEIGPKDIEKKSVTLARRDTGKKDTIAESKIANVIESTLNNMQNSLFSKAKKFLNENIDSAKSIKELNEKLNKRKIVKVYMYNNPEIEEKIKQETNGAVSRIIEETKKEGFCVQSGKKTKTIAYIAKAY